MKALVLAALGALPYPSNPPSPYSVDGQPHFVVSGGPARSLIVADPFGTGARVRILGWYDASGVARFYAVENPQLYNAPAYRAAPTLTPYAGITRDPDGSLNGGLAIGALKPETGESMTGNNDVAGEVFKEATREEMERRRCGPDGCDDDADDSGYVSLSPAELEDLGLSVAIALAMVGVLYALIRRRRPRSCP